MPLKQRSRRLQRNPMLLNNGHILKILKFKGKRRKSKEQLDGIAKGIKSKIQFICDVHSDKFADLAVNHLNSSDSDDAKSITVNEVRSCLNFECSNINCVSTVDLNLTKAKLSSLLSDWRSFHPNHLFLRQVDSVNEDKIDEVLRNEAISHLRFIHKSFLKLCDRTFAQAVNLIDRFFVKVKVKPRYGNCVVAGCYLIMAEENNEENVPNCDDLCKISRCGGTSKDLERMVRVIRDKNIDLHSITSMDFLSVMLSGVMGEKWSTSGSRDLLAELADDLQVVMCYLEYYTFNPACVALALLLHQGLRNDHPFGHHNGVLWSVEQLQTLAKFCEVDWCDVQECLSFVQGCSNQKLYRRGGDRAGSERGQQRRRTPVSLTIKTLASISEDESEQQFDEWSGLDQVHLVDDDDEAIWDVANLFECY